MLALMPPFRPPPAAKLPTLLVFPGFLLRERRFGEDLPIYMIEDLKLGFAWDGASDNCATEFETSIRVQIVRSPFGQAWTIRAAGFRELRPIGAHRVAKLFLISIVLPIR